MTKFFFSIKGLSLKKTQGLILKKKKISLLCTALSQNWRRNLSATACMSHTMNSTEEIPDYIEATTMNLSEELPDYIEATTVNLSEELPDYIEATTVYELLNDSANG